jgi:hypothetical protein
MNRRTKIYFVIILLAGLLVIFLSMYFFNIYGDIVEKSPKNIYADVNSVITIRVVPLNAFGVAVPFRKSSADFHIIEGENLVEVVEKDTHNGFLKLRSKGIPGSVEISIKSSFSLFPNLVSFEIFALTG